MEVLISLDASKLLQVSITGVSNATFYTFRVFSGELLRKKRREKDGHKDPLLQEISHLQEEVMTQISNLRKEHEAAEKKRNEIDKVALILGLSPSDRPRRTSKPAENQEDKPPPPEKKKREPERSDDGRQAASSSAIKVQTPAEEVKQEVLLKVSVLVIARAHCFFYCTSVYPEVTYLFILYIYLFI